MIEEQKAEISHILLSEKKKSMFLHNNLWQHSKDEAIKNMYKKEKLT